MGINLTVAQVEALYLALCDSQDIAEEIGDWHHVAELAEIKSYLAIELFQQSDEDQDDEN